MPDGNSRPYTPYDEQGRPYQKLVQEASGIEKARDLFCFCAFTSLRFSDMYKLRRSDIDYQSMKPYINIASADKSKAMDLFDKWLEITPPADSRAARGLPGNGLDWCSHRL